MSPYREPTFERDRREPWLALALLALVAISTAALAIGTAAYARAGDAWRQCGGIAP